MNKQANNTSAGSFGLPDSMFAPADQNAGGRLPPVDAVGKVTVSSDKMRAFLHVTLPKYGGNPLMPEQIRNLIADAGIRHGLRELTVTHLSAQPLYDRDILIAEGTPPIKGKDGFLTYHVRLSKDAAPTEHEDGSVDYKDLGIVENVVKDQVLCVKTPPEPGTPGMNIKGERVLALPGKEVPLPVGKNTYISEDKLELRANIDGQCDYVDRRLNVMETFFVKGDVSTATGNISFIGNVVVSGNVLTGFSIKAGGNIHVEGCVEGASLTAGGNITIRDGFQGMNKGEIIAGGSVRCKYIQSGRVRAGTLIEAQNILQSEVQSADVVKLPGVRATIMGGRVMAKNLIDCQRIGNLNNPARTVVEVGSDPFLLIRAQELKNEMELLKKTISDIDRVLLLFQQLKNQNRLTDEKYEMMIRSVNSRRTAAETLAALRQEAEDLRLRLATEGYGSIIARTSIYQGVHVVIGGEQQSFEEATGAVMITRGENGLHMQAPAPGR